MFDITALGEALIDFTMAGRSEGNQRLFEQNPGGAPANLLAAANGCGLKTAFLGKLGDDMHGQFLAETLSGADIDISGVVIDPNYFTTLAFVAINDNGERAFSFARKASADIMLTPEEVNVDIIAQSRIFHVGSLSLTHEPCRSATLFALEEAKKAGCIRSYDPNYRASLWESEGQAMEQMRSVLPYMDVMKISDEETALLTGEPEPEKAAAKLIAQGLSVVAVTLGADGAYVCTKDGGDYVKGYPSQSVDTTGAGDSFFGGFLYKLLSFDTAPKDITLAQAMDCANFGNALASLCVEGRGGIPSMPNLATIDGRYIPIA